MSDDVSEGPDALMTACDVCGAAVAKFDALTVPWADLTACSMDCKQRWQNAQRRHL